MIAPVRAWLGSGTERNRMRRRTGSREQPRRVRGALRRCTNGVRGLPWVRVTHSSTSDWAARRLAALVEQETRRRASPPRRDLVAELPEFELVMIAAAPRAGRRAVGSPCVR